MTDKISSAPLEEQSSSTSLLDLMKIYVHSKLCYNSNVLTNAKVTNTKERVAYQIDLWTLMERRWTEERTKPYENESVNPQPIVNPWDIAFPKPTTILKKKEKQKYDLDRTRRVIVCDKCNDHCSKMCYSCTGKKTKSCTCSGYGTGLYYNERQNCTRCHGTGSIRCSTCNATGQIDCHRCNARGQLLVWYQVIFEYYTLHSISYQTNTPLPSSRIRKAPMKDIYWSTDQEWSNTYAFDNYFQTTFANQQGECPVKLNELTEQYTNKHLGKTKPECQIIRLKCEIQKLNVTEVEYEADGFMNKRNTNMNNKFKFYYYGRGNKNEVLIYEDDYPLNTCGCFGVGCAHYSKCCTIL